MKAAIIVLCILIGLALFVAYTICRSAQKKRPDKDNPCKWYDDENNEYYT